MNILLISTSFSNQLIFDYLFEFFNENNNVSFFTLDKRVSKVKHHINYLPNKFLLKKELKKYNPDFIIFDAANHNNYVAEIVSFCKKQNVKHVCLIDRLKGLDIDFQLMEKPDNVITCNQEVYNQLKDTCNVLCVKNFYPYAIKQMGLTYKKTINYEQPKIIYISQTKLALYSYVVAQAFRDAIDEKHTIYIKKHYRDKLNNWENQFKNCKMLECQQLDDVLSEMVLADLIIGTDSELLLMSAALGIPTIFYTENYKEEIKDFFELRKFKKHFIPEKFRESKMSIAQAILTIIEK